VPQIVYYFSAYCDLMNAGKISQGEKVNFVVPTGNFGNILAGWYAKRMGLPIKKLICASNENRVLPDFFSTGRYDRNRPFFCTSSPSMDILISSNLERLLYLLLQNNNAATMNDLMAQLDKYGCYDIPYEVYQRLQKEFAAGSCDETQCAAAIRKAFEEQGYLSDPHTAVALHVLEQYRAATGDNTRSVVVSTASPYKFAEEVCAAIDGSVVRDFSAVERLNELSGTVGYECAPTAISGLKNKPVLHNRVCAAEDMPAQILDFLRR
jgi:threonine synthase